MKKQLSIHLLTKKLLTKLPLFKSFLKEPNIAKHSKPFKIYAPSQKVKVFLKIQHVNLISLNLILKIHEDLLAKIKDFWHETIFQIRFHKEIHNGEGKYWPPIYFKYNTGTVINNLDINDSLETSYQLILPKVRK